MSSNSSSPSSSYSSSPSSPYSSSPSSSNVSSPSSFNASLPSPSAPSFTNFFYVLQTCYSSRVGVFCITAYTVIAILLILPPCLLILHLAVQRWRQRCSSAAVSHSDVFTYHMVANELLHFLASVFTLCSAATGLSLVATVSILILSIGYNAQIYFHILTCVERYLAVVHPVTYRNLGKENGVRIRNVSTGCAWLLSIVATSLMITSDLILMNAVLLCFLSLILVIISFCSLSVLCVLIRPGPGERGGARQRVDQSKLRAFYTITAILGVLLVRFVGNILTSSLYNSLLLEESERCGAMMMTFWVGLPSSLVAPLLFLHRAGKLPCRQRRNQQQKNPK
ncbi:uncharacterized protein V6R79_017440 [Siganus canaliculatus]